MDFFERRFTGSQVALAAGVSPQEVAHWTAIRLVTGQRDARGRGVRRQYSAFNLMEIALAAELLRVGFLGPSAAFEAAQKFSHTGLSGGPAPSGEAREPGLPFHYREGGTWLIVSGKSARVVLVPAGRLELAELLPEGHRPRAFIAVDASDVFARALSRLGIDFRDVLNAAYARAA